MEFAMTVKPELEGEYREYVEMNSKDPYSRGVLTASCMVAQGLDDGLSIKNAVDTINELGITGFMAGCMAQAISRFHPRGEEFRQWWNRDNQISDEGDRANEAGGVLNPAILNIRRS